MRRSPRCVSKNMSAEICINGKFWWDYLPNPCLGWFSIILSLSGQIIRTKSFKKPNICWLKRLKFVKNHKGTCQKNSVEFSTLFLTCFLMSHNLKKKTFHYKVFYEITAQLQSELSWNFKLWSYSERNVSYWIFKQVAHVENALYIRLAFKIFSH